MKKKYFAAFAFLVVLALLLAGCKEPEPVYTVWTFRVTATNYNDGADPEDVLNDGYWESYEIPSGPTSFSDDYKRVWTKAEIQEFLDSTLGLPSAKAAEKAVWFTTVSHGVIASRTGDWVYMIIK